MARERPSAKEPQPITYRDVPPNVGEGRGRVCLYDSRAGLPALLDTPIPKLLKGLPFVLVHFPSRRHVAVKTKAKGLEMLRALVKGADATGVTGQKRGEKAAKGRPAAKIDATIPKTGKRAGVAAPPSKGAKPGKTSEPLPAQAGAGARAKPESPAPAEEQASEHAGPPDEKRTDGFTPVPDGSTFDQAMQKVFSPGRLTRELERLMTFRKTVYTKDGDEIGQEDEPFVQLNALKTAIAYHQGRPAEKEKPAPEKPRISLDELQAKILTDDAALEFMEALVAKARAVREAPAPAPTAAPPATS